MDAYDEIERLVWLIERQDIMISGSHREGFRLETSDFDQMTWLSDHKVICDLSQISLYRMPQHTVILMECEDLPPGFTRLKLMTLSWHIDVNSSSVIINGGSYVSSSLFKSRFLQSMQSQGGVGRWSIPHGPCATYNVHGQDFDCVHCFQSHHWSNDAFQWIQKCQLQHWPQENVLSPIINDGCHVVPISSAPSNPEKDIEWRVSFSRVEQKLVYSMNHCQFLCYGLLKLFLKEVINACTNDTSLCCDCATLSVCLFSTVVVVSASLGHGNIK